MWPMIIMGAAAAYGAIAGSEATKAQGKEAVRRGNIAQYEGLLDQKLRGVEAQQVQAQSVAEANNIKRQALNMRASLVSAQAGSGVVIGEGSAQAAIDQIDTLASADVLAVLYSGAGRATAIRQQGRMSGAAGLNAGRSGAITGATLGRAAQTQLIGGLLQAGASAAQAYGSSTAPKTTPTKGA